MAEMTMENEQRLEADMLQQLQQGDMARDMVNASRDDLERTAAFLEKTRPLDSSNAFWERHTLPDDTASLDDQLTRVEALKPVREDQLALDDLAAKVEQLGVTRDVVSNGSARRQKMVKGEWQVVKSTPAQGQSPSIAYSGTDALSESEKSQLEKLADRDSQKLAADMEQVGYRVANEAQQVAPEIDWNEEAEKAREREEKERELDPDSEAALSAKEARKEAEYQAAQAELPESERDNSRLDEGVTINVADNLAKADARALQLSEEAQARYEQYNRDEINFKDITATDDLAEGYEINRLVAHSRVQHAKLEKGEITEKELAKDDDYLSGRELEDQLERARQKRIEKDEERGEIAMQSMAQSHDSGNKIEDFDVAANGQHRDRVPPEVEKDFPGRQVGKAKTHYYSKDLNRVAFVDKGDKLQSPKDFDQQGVRAMVDTAKARGWQEVKVTGAESFRRQAYLEAARRGIEVKGYKPTEAERKQADKSKAQAKRRDAVADAFKEADTPQEKQAAAKEHGKELTKAYALEASLKAWERKHNVPKQTRQALEKNLHDSIERDLRNGRSISEVKLKTRRQEKQTEATLER